ncbi:MAG: hypothetical protein IJN53_06505 [Oscillospiraceae bacterium]|nr:hypothetical protein [Oscillospiraceae bacterium]
MKLKMHKLLEEPEAPKVLAMAGFCILFFLFGTVLIALLSSGLGNSHKVLSWFEIVFHLICMMVAVPVMWEYLTDSWLMRGAEAMRSFCLCLLTVLLVLVYSQVLQRAPLSGKLEEYSWVYQSATPLLTHNLFLTNAYMVELNPLYGTLCAVLVAPAVTCCMFYATAFVKGYNVHPLLGYALVILATLFLPFCTGVVGMWEPGPQFVQWAVRLPIHLLCCKLYRDTDNIWMPIFAQAGINLISCLLVIYTW